MATLFDDFLDLDGIVLPSCLPGLAMDRKPGAERMGLKVFQVAIPSPIYLNSISYPNIIQ